MGFSGRLRHSPSIANIMLTFEILKWLNALVLNLSNKGGNLPPKMMDRDKNQSLVRQSMT